MRISDWSSDVCSSDLLKRPMNVSLLLSRPTVLSASAPSIAVAVFSSAYRMMGGASIGNASWPRQLSGGLWQLLRSFRLMMPTIRSSRPSCHLHMLSTTYPDHTEAINELGKKDRTRR